LWAKSSRFEESARPEEPEEIVGDGARCLGWERARWDSRWRSCWVIWIFTLTIDDPKAYTKPWKAELIPDTELLEFVCNE
jgi:hypothetical protein